MYYVKKTQESFTADQDILLMNAIVNGDYGEWDKILESIKINKKYRFKFTLPTIDTAAVEKRTNQLLRFFLSMESTQKNYFEKLTEKCKETQANTASTATPNKDETINTEEEKPKSKNSKKSGKVQQTLDSSISKIKIQNSSTTKSRQTSKERKTKPKKDEIVSSSTKKKPKSGKEIDQKIAN